MDKTLSEGLKAAFIDQGFINTMRFSELNGDEEYDNTFLFIAWHGYLETGLQQLRAYNEDLLFNLERIEGISLDDLKKLVAKYPPSKTPGHLFDEELFKLPYSEPVVKLQSDYQKYLEDLINSEQVKTVIPYEQRMRILRYIGDYFTAWKTIALMAIRGERDGKKAIGTIRQYLADYNENLGVDFSLFYDGHTALLNGRMARDRGHKKELMSVAHGRGVGGPITEEEKKKHWWSRG